MEDNEQLKTMNNTLELIKAEFGVEEDYSLTEFKDKGNSGFISLDNKNFKISVLIKDFYAQGIKVEE